MKEKKITLRRRIVLFGLPLLFVAAMSWVGWSFWQQRSEEAAIAWVEEIGGRVTFKPRKRNIRWQDLVYLTRKKGWSVIVDLSDTEVSDLSPLADLKHLTELDIKNTHVRNLSPLAELKNLVWIYIGNTPVGDDDVQELRKALPNCNIRNNSRRE